MFKSMKANSSVVPSFRKSCRQQQSDVNEKPGDTIRIVQFSTHVVAAAVAVQQRGGARRQDLRDARAEQLELRRVRGERHERLQLRPFQIILDPRDCALRKQPVVSASRPKR